MAKLTPRMPEVKEPTSPEEILPGIRNIVTRKQRNSFEEGLELKPGERVMIVTDSTINPILGEAFQEAIRDAGGHADMVTLEGYPGMDDPLALVDGPNTTNWYPDWLWKGAAQADVVLCLAFLKFPHTPALPWGIRQRPSAGFKARPIQWELPPDMVMNASLTYPMDIWEAIDDKTHELMFGARRLEITDPNGGTHLTLDLTDEDWGQNLRGFGEEAAGAPGSTKEYFPAHLFIPFPKSGAFEGEITIDSLTFGGPVEPARLTVQGRRVTEVHGTGAFPDTLRQSFDDFKDQQYPHLPGPGANWISTFALCTNPKYRRSPSYDTAKGSAKVHAWCLGHRRSGFLHASVGAAQVGEFHKVIRHFDMMYTN
ncbi:MAG TPA: hypothetical protein VGK54_10935, partial [Chloroflexota bacterium]